VCAVSTGLITGRAPSTGVIAGLFPGQGSQAGDLREGVERVVPELYRQCVELVGEDPFPRVRESTRFAQPAIFCASIAGWVELRAHVRTAALAGHSLGELSALVAAGSLDSSSGLELAVRRGALMSSAETSEAEGMLAVLGARPEQVGELAGEHEVVVANDNAPGQVVLAGPVARLRSASLQAREFGARAILLDVAGAFHSPAMAPAVEPFRAALDSVEFGPPAIPVISGSSAQPFADVRAELAAAIVRPVRWRETMLALAGLGADRFVDFGPGRVLAGLVRRNLPDAVLIDPEALSSASDLEASGVA
jgi:[acyl-carrier-protein] S-malonyltransferase